MTTKPKKKQKNNRNVDNNISTSLKSDHMYNVEQNNSNNSENKRQKSPIDDTKIEIHGKKYNKDDIIRSSPKYVLTPERKPFSPKKNDEVNIPQRPVSPKKNDEVNSPKKNDEVNIPQRPVSPKKNDEVNSPRKFVVSPVAFLSTNEISEISENIIILDNGNSSNEKKSSDINHIENNDKSFKHIESSKTIFKQEERKNSNEQSKENNSISEEINKESNKDNDEETNIKIENNILEEINEQSNENNKNSKKENNDEETNIKVENNISDEINEQSDENNKNSKEENSVSEEIDKESNEDNDEENKDIEFYPVKIDNIRIPKVIDYSKFSKQKQFAIRNEFMIKFGILRESFPEYNIPHYGNNISLTELHLAYERICRHKVAKNNAKSYKEWLVTLWMGEELTMVKGLGINASGFTMNQLANIDKYKDLLLELGEKKSIIFMNSDWPVEIRIFFLSVINFLFFIAMRYLAIWIGPEIAEIVKNLFDGKMFHDNSSKEKKVSGNIPDIPEDYSGSGFGNILANLGTAYTKNAVKKNNLKKKGGIRRPKFREL